MIRFVFVDWSPKPHEYHQQTQHLHLTNCCQYPLVLPILADNVFQTHITTPITKYQGLQYNTYFCAELVQLTVSRSDSEREVQRYGMKKNS